MSVYQALYRKWRPMRFCDISGQKQVSDTLKTAVATGRTSHAYLFCGTRGTGKTSTAKIFSRAVNCENPIDGEPCNECPTCKGILNGSILDVYEMDAASNRGVENIREIRDEVIYTPVGCKYKVYIIDEVHMLTAEAFNALLKTLEEPPSHAIFVLATTEPHKIPATVLSRCQRFDFKRISVDDIAKRLGVICDAEGIDITPDAVETVAEIGDGSMRDAISTLDRCSALSEGTLTADRISEIMGFVGQNSLFEIVDAVANNDAKTTLKISDAVLKDGKEPQNLIENLISHYRSLLICKATDKPGELLEKTETASEKYRLQSEKYSVERILYSIKTLGEYLAQSKWLSNPKLAVEQAAVKLCFPSYSTDTDALLARIEKLETAVAKLSAGAVTGGYAVTQTESVSASDGVHSENNERKSELPSDANSIPASGGIPPWDTSDGKTKDLEMASENLESVNKPAVDTTIESKRETTSEVGSWDLWADALNEIKKESKMLYAFLYNGSAERCGNSIEVEVEGEVAYGRISTPDGINYLSKMFSGVAGEPLSVKVYIKGQRERKRNDESSKPNEPSGNLSIDDLAKKKEMFGDKMDIL